MKRTLLTFSVVVASACTMYGQARVYFSMFDPVSTCTDRPPRFVGADYSAQLLWKAGTFTDMAAFLAATPNSSAAFPFFGTTGGSPTTDGAGFVDGGFVALGGPAGTYTMLVQAWYNGGVCPTYGDALAAIADSGRSALFTMNVTEPPVNFTPAPSFCVAGCLAGPRFKAFDGPISQAVALGAGAAFSVAFDTYDMPCPLPFYQWYFNGVPIRGATSNSLQITSAQLTNAGSYHVVLTYPLSYPYGNPHISSPVATLTVLMEPIITSPPQTQTAEMGSAVSLWAQATNSLPLFYEWYHNETNFIGCSTNCELVLTNVQYSQSGAYSVVMSNALGAVTSAPAMLNVIAPVERKWVPGLMLIGQAGNPLNLEITDTLVPTPSWAAFDSVLLSETAQWYFDLTTPRLPQRYFRASQAGVQVAPALDAHLIPALTLTSAIGSKLRVDGINQFGPTDAWFPVATVTLTNTAQFYFDVSVIGQPPRLWRLLTAP